MGFSRMLFTNVKTFTPRSIKTLPFAKTALPELGVKQSLQFRFNRSPGVVWFHKLLLNKVFLLNS